MPRSARSARSRSPNGVTAPLPAPACAGGRRAPRLRRDGRPPPRSRRRRRGFGQPQPVRHDAAQHAALLEQLARAGIRLPALAGDHQHDRVVRAAWRRAHEAAQRSVGLVLAHAVEVDHGVDRVVPARQPLPQAPLQGSRHGRRGGRRRLRSGRGGSARLLRTGGRLRYRRPARQRPRRAAEPAAGSRRRLGAAAGHGRDVAGHVRPQRHLVAGQGPAPPGLHGTVPAVPQRAEHDEIGRDGGSSPARRPPPVPEPKNRSARAGPRMAEPGVLRDHAGARRRPSRPSPSGRSAAIQNGRP